MGLALYLSPSQESKITSINPFRLTYDGRIGGIQDIKIYIRNDDINKWYSDIYLSVIDNGISNIVNNPSNNWYWKLNQSDIDISDIEWNDISCANTISIDDIGTSSLANIVTFVPVWVRVSIPNKQYIQVINSVVFRLEAKENVVE